MSAAARQIDQPDYSIAETEIAGVRLVLDPAGVAFLPAERVLVVSDLHLEKGSSFARRGVFLPPYDTSATLAMLARMVALYDPAIVVSLGDSFHDDEGAERLPSQATGVIAAIARGREMIWIAGNHDPSFGGGLPGFAAQEIAIAGLTFRHVPARGAAGAGEIAGHLHPSARIVRRGRSVRRPCFAADGARMIMPSFGVFTGGLNVLDRAFAGLFDLPSLTAFMTGADRIYPIARRHLCG
ncbi:MAG TPA: ligase-associated DNA damage response endonuclease PdeM [Rhizobiaceae bacterium]|nr:ligase-associated DNA damage response endonuclease PdeM [Rhizobiaceae bacterium]